jgi:hypothetical protein
MSTWKSGKVWTYQFIFKGARYSGSGFRTKAQAKIAQEKRRSALRLGIEREKLLQTIKPIVPNDEIYRFEALKKNYHALVEKTQTTLPDLIDMMMEDFELPYRFKDVAQVVRNLQIKKPKIPAQLRMRVIERDNATCQICGAKGPDVRLHVDHIIPVSRGGLTEERNLRMLCEKCNLGKSDKVLHVKG